MKDEELNQQLESESKYRLPEKAHRFGVYNFLVFALLMFLVWIVGQFTPGIPDEQIIELIGMLIYIWYGVNPLRKK